MIETLGSGAGPDWLKFLCCPECHADLESETESLLCTGCAARYPLVDGIPVFVGASEPQKTEHDMRESVARGWLDRAPEQLLRRVSKHHNVPVMEEAVARFGRGIAEGCIVDIGCGWGWHWRAYRGPRPVLAVDFSLGNCTLAQTKFLAENPNVCVICADARKLPIRAAAGVWSVQAFQHLPPTVMEAVLLEIRRLARPRGLVAEIIDTKPVGLVRFVYGLFRRPYPTRVNTAKFYIHRRTPADAQALFGQLSQDLELGYSELFFHPDVLLRWNRWYPAAFEDKVSRTALGRAIARQLHVRVKVAGEQSSRACDVS